MAQKRRLPQTFPHRVILVASLTLCLCALGGVVLAVLSWNNRVWGYYFGTGFWSGGVILMTGIFGIVASYVRNVCSVKTFMIFAIFGFVVSLAMIALSCGGLDPDSGFYDGYPTNTVLHYICHGGYLGLGVLQISLCVLSDAISIYYLFVERHAEIYSVKLRSKGKPLKRKRPRSKDSNRASTSSSAPLVGGSVRSRSDSRGSKKGKQPVQDTVDGGDEAELPIIRNRGSFVKSQNGLDPTSPIRSPCVRPVSFTTFGHTDAQAERVSLIVHPDDNMSVADTNRSQMSDNDSSHYAQTMLWGPPLPIEEDEELPPYEPYEGQPDATADSRLNSGSNRDLEAGPSSFQLRRAISAPLYSKRRKDFRSSYGKSCNMPTKSEAVVTPTAKNDAFNEFSKYIIDRSELSSRLSQSEDLLNDDRESGETIQNNLGQSQGVQLRDFSRSIDKISDPEGFQGNNRSQSVRAHREPHLDRRKRAQSAEFKHTKYHNKDYGNRLDPDWMAQSEFNSTSALFAGTKTMPSKFSLRTRLSQKGPRAAIPVKSVSSLPLFSPPPKPPRTHSVTLEDLANADKDMSNEGEDENNIEKQPHIQQSSVSVTNTGNENKSARDRVVDAVSGTVQPENQNDNTTVEAVNKPNFIKGVPSTFSKTEQEHYMQENIPVQVSSTRPPTLTKGEINFKADDDVFLPQSQDTRESEKENVNDKVKTVKVYQQTITVEPRGNLVSKTNDGQTVPANSENRDSETMLKAEKKEHHAEVTLDSGPVLLLKAPEKRGSVNDDRSNDTRNKMEKTRGDSTSSDRENAMSLPVSPIIKQPILKESHEIKKQYPPDPVYGKAEKKPPEILPKPHMHKLPSSVITTHDNSGKVSNVSNVQTPSVFPEKNEPKSSDVRARSSPLSPSERIIHRYSDRPIINTQGVPKWDADFRTNEGRNPFVMSAESNGARPKTTFFRRSSSEDPDERPIRPLVREDPRNVSNITRGRPSSLSNSRVYPSQNTSPVSKRFSYQPKFSFAYPDQTSPTSSTSPTSNRSSVSSLQSRNKQSVQRPNSSAQPTQSAQHSNTNGTPNGASHVAPLPRPVSASTGASASSQGVLHLVQSQYQRQVTDNREGAGVPAGNGSNANPQPLPAPLLQQNIAQQQNQDDEKPFFSVVL